MTLERKNFFLLTIAFTLSSLIVTYQGVSLVSLFSVSKRTIDVFLWIPFLVLSYHMLYFLCITGQGLYTQKLNYFCGLQYDYRQLYRDIKKSILFSLLLAYLVVFQTTFKSIFAWHLWVPNNLDWLLYSLDRVILGPSVWWWGTQLLNEGLWQSIVVFLDRFYMPYFAYQWFVVMYIMFNEKNAYHKDIFVTMFFLIWIIGTMLGGLCQSGGPFFFSYASWNLYQVKALTLMHQMTPLFTINTQNYLWISYFNADYYALAGGISAFPSLHVAMSMFIYLYAIEKGNKFFIWITAIGCFLTWLGSIILGWHYLVDGFGALFVVYLAKTISIALHKSLSSKI